MFDLDPDQFIRIKAFLMGLAFSQPRILAMFAVVPIFNRAILPGMLRAAVAGGLGLVIAPSLTSSLAGVDLNAVRIVSVIAKEAFVGLVLGCLIAVPFWAFEGIGFLVDNQRGASIAATLNPLTGNDSSPMGILFNQAFIVFFFISGAFTVMLDLMYDSFRLWNVFTWWPHFRPESMPLFTELILRLVKLTLLLSAPVIIAMFLSEIGLALVSRFVPNLQVFFLAMPIKSALAVLVFIVYLTTLFDYAVDLIQPLREVVPLLDGQWRAPPGAKR